MKIWIIGCSVVFFLILFPAIALVAVVITVLAMASKA